MTADAIWVRTSPTDGRRFGVALEVDDDTARFLSPPEAVAYANTVLRVIGRAEYDAAVFKQLLDRTEDVRTAAQVVIDMRLARAEVDDNATRPLVFRDGVAFEGHRPFITIARDTAAEPFCQWTTEAARGHAMHVLEGIIAAELDTAYLSGLIDTVGLREPVARNVVDDLARWR